MAKPPRKKDQIELRPDGWERFTTAVDAAVKHGPEHRAAAKTKTRRQQTRKSKRAK